MKVISIENSVIDSMVRNKNLTDNFPFLINATSKAKSGCGGCGSGQLQIDYALIKRTVATLGQNDQARLKSLLGVDQIRVNRRINGRMVPVEF